MELVKRYLQNIFTGSDNETYSMSKIAALVSVSALAYEFIRMASVDFQGFGVAVAAIIAALAAKTAVEK